MAHTVSRRRLLPRTPTPVYAIGASKASGAELDWKGLALGSAALAARAGAHGAAGSSLCPQQDVR